MAYIQRSAVNTAPRMLRNRFIDILAVWQGYRANAQSPDRTRGRAPRRRDRLAAPFGVKCRDRFGVSLMAAAPRYRDTLLGCQRQRICVRASRAPEAASPRHPPVRLDQRQHRRRDGGSVEGDRLLAAERLRALADVLGGARRADRTACRRLTDRIPL
jgi:hypothetical protein